MKACSGILVACCVVAVAAFGGRDAVARDAAFLDPGTTTASAGMTGEAVDVEPSVNIDTGESVLNIARRTTLFFVNRSTAAVTVERVAANGDGNVRADIVADDCSKSGTIAGNSRCSVVVEVTPSSSGPWTTEVLMTHTGAGRIARARLIGKTTGTGLDDKKNAGLSLNTKEAPPINFGDVDADGVGKSVRSALMVNDSSDPITLLGIDVIAADNGLQRLDQGCAIDMELKPGESCPVTLMWQPEAKGKISTDLIIRHSGRLGFAVIPIRGNAREVAGAAKPSGKDTAGGKGGPPSSLPTADELDRMAGGAIPPLSQKQIEAAVAPALPSVQVGDFRLIGTVGNKALILKPDGSTAVVESGESLKLDGGRTIKITNVTPRSASLDVNGTITNLSLQQADDLVRKAADRRAQTEATTAGKPVPPSGAAGGVKP